MPLRLPLLALSTAILVAGCNSSDSDDPTIDNAKVADAIAKSIIDQRGVKAPVRCPDGVARTKGETFTCTAAFDVGRYEIPVAVTDAEGNVDWKADEPLTLLNISSVETSIRRSVRDQRDVNALVKCPERVLQRKGLTFTCKATVKESTKAFEAGTYGFKVTIRNDTGRVTYAGI
jgi:hypothetical protein